MTATAPARTVPSESEFAGLYLQHRSMVERTVAKFIRYRIADREDIVQEVFLRAFRMLHQFRGDSSFSTWLGHIAFTESMMFLRRIRREEERFCGELMVEPVDGARDLAALLTDRQLAAEILAAVPKNDRQLLLRFHFDGASIQELATEIGHTRSYVRLQLYRARDRVRPHAVALSHFSAKGVGA